MGCVPMETEHSRLVLMLWALMSEGALQVCGSSACGLASMDGLTLNVLNVFVPPAVQ